MTAEKNLRKAFADICMGYSVLKLDPYGIIYVKHMSHFEQTKLDDYYDEFFSKAQAKKIPTKQEKAKWLDDKKLWTRKDDARLSEQRAFVTNMEKTMKQMFLKSQIDQQKKTLDIERAKLNKMIAERGGLIGLTCEKYAEQRMTNFYLLLALFKDKKLESPLFNDDEFNKLEEEEIDYLLSEYVGVIRRFEELDLKRIAIANFFISYFYNCEEDYQAFFGKPLAFLTYNQLNLLYYGKYFKSIMQDSKIPDNIKDDPEKIEEFIAANAKAKEVMGKIGGGDAPVGLVGATKQDLAYLGLDGRDPDMQKAVKAGGINSIEQMARL